MQKQWVPEDHAHLARRGGGTKIKALQKVEDLDPILRGPINPQEFFQYYVVLKVPMSNI